MTEKKAKKRFKINKKVVIVSLVGMLITATLLTFGFEGINPLSKTFSGIAKGASLFYFPQFPTRLAFLVG